MVTIIDIAEAAGVSHQVVSKTLNGGAGNAGASHATREKIQSLAKKMGYRRHAAGHAMRQGKTRTVGILVGSGEDFLLPEPMIRSLVEGFSKVGYGCTLHAARTGSARDIFDSPVLSEVTADCLLISYVRNLSPATVRRVEAIGTPVIWMNRRSRWNSVAVDEAHGMRLLAAHLEECGHRHLLFVDYSADPKDPFYVERLHALESFCARRGIGLTKVQKKLPRVERTHDVAHWLAKSERPTAVIANSLSTAQIINQTALSMGFQLPQDLSLASFDNSSWHLASVPAITCALRSDAEFGQTVAQAALARIADPSAPFPSIKIPFVLSIGGTTTKKSVNTH